MDKKYRRPKCFCGTSLRPDGACPFLCPPSANPKHLRAEVAKARKLDWLPTRFGVNEEERKRSSAALAKLDPIYRGLRKIAFGAAIKSHKPGANR